MITSCTFLGTGTAGVHDSDALSRQCDIVMASSVTTVQSSPEMIAVRGQSTSRLDEAWGRVELQFPDGTFRRAPGEKGS